MYDTTWRSLWLPGLPEGGEVLAAGFGEADDELCHFFPVGF